VDRPGSAGLEAHPPQLGVPSLRAPASYWNVYSSCRKRSLQVSPPVYTVNRHL